MKLSEVKKKPKRKRTRKRKNKSRKGGAWERKFAKLISLWWSNNARDDLFWRTQTSGGRATQRAKSGQETYGQYGDISAIHPKAQPLLDVICFELKNGYHNVHMLNIVDSPRNDEKQFTEWIGKAERDSIRSNSFSWAIVHQRTKRAALIYFPIRLWSLLGFQNIIFSSELDLSSEIYPERIICVRLDEFLEAACPKKIRKMRNKICDQVT